MNTLESRIKLVLDENPDLKPADLVAASGASASVVSQWMDGKIKSMRLDYALAVEAALGYNHVWLVLGTGDRRVRKPLSFSDLTGTEAQLLMFYRSLPEHRKHELEAIANRMATEGAITPTAGNPYPERDQFGGKLLGRKPEMAKKKAG